jgi:hypothetical protein
MLTKLSLALMASLILTATVAAEETKQPPTAPPQALNAILCKTETQAIAFADDSALGWTASWITPFQSASLERGA